MFGISAFSETPFSSLQNGYTDLVISLSSSSTVDASAVAKYQVSSTSATTSSIQTSVIGVLAGQADINSLSSISSSAVCDYSALIQLNAESSFISSVSYTTKTSANIDSISILVANARYKWENETDTSESWTDITDQSETWTTVIDQSESWTRVN